MRAAKHPHTPHRITPHHTQVPSRTHERLPRGLQCVAYAKSKSNRKYCHFQVWFVRSVRRVEVFTIFSQPDRDEPIQNGCPPRRKAVPGRAQRERVWSDNTLEIKNQAVHRAISTTTCARMQPTRGTGERWHTLMYQVFSVDVTLEQGIA
jgi:hypothetical protein